MNSYGVSVGNDKIIRIWDIATMTQFKAIITPHTALINAIVYS